MYQQDGIYSVSTDRRQTMDGLTRIWDERHNAYLTDADGEVLTFPTPYDAQRWLEQQWIPAVGISAT
jgi:hypothetical protein